MKARDLLFNQLENWYPTLMSPPESALFERSKGYLDALRERFITLSKQEDDYKLNFTVVWTEAQIVEGVDGLIQLEIDLLNVAKGYLDLMNEVQATCKEELDLSLKRYKMVAAQTAENQKKAQENKQTEQDYFTSLQTVANLENAIDQAKLDLSNLKELEILTDDSRIHRIPESIIISSSFTETKPTFTRLDVSGEPELVNEEVAQSTIYLAAGVDFDLWRTYGYISNSITVPYFHRAMACKPYNEILLGRQWGLIFSAELTLRGDSKYKLNDTVYIESRDMYFRIAGITHSFTYGNTYQTSLTLDYGRRPEFLIPDPWLS